MGTNYKGSKAEINALNTYIKLIRAAQSITARLNSRITKEGLTESQFSILEALFHIGPLCQRDLAGKLLQSGGNITMVIDNLEKQGLVKRQRGEKDRRFFTVHLTQKGKSSIENLFPKHLTAITEEISILTEKEQHEFQRMCKLIGLQKQESGIEKNKEKI